MAESQRHVDLIRSMEQWVRNEFEQGRWGLCVLCDLPEAGEKPPIIGGFRPDLWARDVPQTVTIIGEAKTDHDLDSRHTSRQLSAYLEYLAFNPLPTLVLSTSWHLRGAAVSVLNRIATELGLDHVRRVCITDGITWDNRT